jgi:hypothetical protein
MTQSQAEEALKRYGSISAAAKALKMDRATFRKRLKGIGCTGPASTAPPPAAKLGRSLADFRAAHDRAYIVPQKIRATLAAMGESWLYEAEFIKASGLTAPDVAAFRDQFAEHLVDVRHEGRRRAVWAGTKALAGKLREMAR